MLLSFLVPGAASPQARESGSVSSRYLLVVVGFLTSGQTTRPSATPTPSSTNKRCVSVSLTGSPLRAASRTAPATALAGRYCPGATTGWLGGLRLPPVQATAWARP